MKYTLVICLLLSTNLLIGQKNNKHITEVKKAIKLPLIDGRMADDCWIESKWINLDNNWSGTAVSKKDFKGRYKLSWSKDALFILVEIKDDELNGDRLTVFIDEDNSGGEHQYNYNAFAYQIALDNSVTNYGISKELLSFHNHLEIKRMTRGSRSVWEIAVHVYKDDFIYEQTNYPIYLTRGKKMGFALAYCDSDKSKKKKSWVGSELLNEQNSGDIKKDADFFGTLVLVD